MTDRLDRRKLRTRSALIAAAQTFLASGSTSVSIQEITDAADVGFGSFYNHFTSKEELFGAALDATLDSWADLLDEVSTVTDDPVKVFVDSFRSTGRLQRAQPQLVRVLLNSGTVVLTRDSGLRPRAIGDLERGIAAGRFKRIDPEVAVMLVGGALLGLLQMLDSNPDMDGAAASDLAAERILVLLGVPQKEAVCITSRPLRSVPHLRLDSGV